MTKNEIDEVVTKTLDEMGLEDNANTRLGNWHMRGISNGEKRRLSIGIEILTQPQIMFLDEPTSGLDSASSFYVISSLRSIAHDGRIVICSIHQPCSEVFNLFDDLVILAGGETVYFGERTMALKVETCWDLDLLQSKYGAVMTVNKSELLNEDRTV